MASTTPSTNPAPPSTMTPITIKQSSKQWSVNLEDFLRSLLAAVITPVIPIVEQTLQAGSLTFNLKSIEIAAAIGFVGFLALKFVSPSSTVITGSTEGSTMHIVTPVAGTKITSAQTK